MTVAKKKPKKRRIVVGPVPKGLSAYVKHRDAEIAKAKQNPSNPTHLKLGKQYMDAFWDLYDQYATTAKPEVLLAAYDSVVRADQHFRASGTRKDGNYGSGPSGPEMEGVAREILELAAD